MSQRSQLQSIQQRLSSTETSEDLAHGQFVIVAARWVLVLAGLVLTLWLPGTLEELRVQIMTLLLLAVVNFYLHAQLLMRRPAADIVAYLASAADLIVVTLLVMQGGAGSNLYIFYFPAIVALSVAFPTEMVVSYAGTTMLVYASVYLYNLDVQPTDVESQYLVARLLVIAAVAVCGNVYWRIEHRRRDGIRGVSGVHGLPNGEIDVAREPARTPAGHSSLVH